MKHLRQTWIWVFVIGVLLFAAALQAVQTGNQRFFPAVIVLGALIVPATAVAYISGYERKIDRGLHRTMPIGSVVWAFIVGGMIGVVTAALIEFATLRTLGIPQLFGVGLVEETAKLILPIVVFIRGQYKSEADGLLFGVASGMGFAALETVGYGFTAFLQSHGNVGAVEQLLIIRGLLSPAGHAAWTGLVCSVLWRERNRAGHAVFNIVILGTFVLAVVLHTSWDIVSTINGLPISAVIVSYLIIAAIGLTLLARRIREAGSKKSSA